MENSDTVGDANSEGNPPQTDSETAQIALIAVQGLESQLATTQEQLAESRDACLRARADGENIRRRAAEEVAGAYKFAVMSFAEAMIPVKDSLEMALMHETLSVGLLKEGIEMTLKQLDAAFERHGLMEILPIRGDKLDPSRHQAVALVPAENQASNTVVTVLQKGYMIADRLLRPAIVTATQEKTAGM
jgi:molecular chaperone GrpE